MQIDASHYPLVFLRESALPQTESPEIESDAILTKELPFVLISDHSPHDDHNEPQQAKKARALFFKRNRETFVRNCAGAIVIDGARTTAMPLRVAAQAFGKAFGVPFHFVPDEDAAVVLANKLLK